MNLALSDQTAGLRPETMGLSEGQRAAFSACSRSVKPLSHKTALCDRVRQKATCIFRSEGIWAEPGYSPARPQGERGEASVPSPAKWRGEGEALLGQSHQLWSPRTPPSPARSRGSRAASWPLPPQTQDLQPGLDTSGPSSNWPFGGRAPPFRLLPAPAGPSGLPWRPQASGALVPQLQVSRERGVQRGEFVCPCERGRVYACECARA